MPVSGNRLGDTDIFIKNVAFELDGLLGAGYVYASYSGQLPADSNGFIDVPFPLSQVIGAVIQISSTQTYANGVPQYCDPVPPASIGALIPYVGFAAAISVMNSSPGVVRCGLRTATYQGTTGSAQTPVGYGSRPVYPGGGYAAVGLAWGIA